MPVADEIQDNLISPFMEERLFQTTPNSIVRLTAGANGDQKQKWVRKVIRQIRTEKDHQGLLSRGYLQIRLLAQEGPEQQIVRIGKGLWPHACPVPALAAEETGLGLVQEALLIPLSQMGSDKRLEIE